MKGKINASHLSLLQHTTQGWGKNYIVNGKSWSLFNFLALLFQPESLFQLKNSEEKCPLSWQGIIFQLLLISSLVSQIVLAKFFLQMMDWLFDCLFYIDNVDLLGENCQPATDGFIMLRHDINMNYDMPLIPVNQHCFNSVSRLPYIWQSLHQQGLREDDSPWEFLKFQLLMVARIRSLVICDLYCTFCDFNDEWMTKVRLSPSIWINLLLNLIWNDNKL